MKAEYILGADAGGTTVKFVLVDAQGHGVDKGEVPTDPHSAEESLRRLADAVRREDGVVRAVGLACAGIVNLETGVLGRSPNLPGWQGADLGAAVIHRFGDVSVALANDVNAALYGEYRAGAGRGCRHLVMIALGTGVGGGVIIDGRLVTGVHHGAGEIGHMVLDPRGPECSCGQAGCLEAWAGSVAILRAARSLAGNPSSTAIYRSRVAELGDELTPRDLAELAEAGDETAAGLFAEVGERIGQALGNLVNVLDPDRLLIGGGVAQAGDLIFAPCRRRIARQVLAEEAKQAPVVAAELGPYAAAEGAAWLARETEPSA